MVPMGDMVEISGYMFTRKILTFFLQVITMCVVVVVAHLDHMAYLGRGAVVEEAAPDISGEV